ncbi:PREDICTED: caveolin-2 [Chinchilla lanigera]|uniref:caveolin-2 n=1 Tax=Chinchilla lanigera TaxID=34839 RepID=UPI000697B4B7|nr:PREDICTED: caveolin-2 [Chinchilla lanigera]
MGLETEPADVQLFVDDGEGARELHAGGERDPHGLNAHLKLGFEDVVAEPRGAHSCDGVWACSHALFELARFALYRLLAALLAVPLAFAAGLLLAALSCLHVWVLMPFVKTCLMVLPSVQTVWKSATDVVLAPLCTSVGHMFSSVSLQLSRDNI